MGLSVDKKYFERSDLMPIAKGYRFLPQIILDQIKLGEKIKSGELEDHILIRSVKNFDSTYYMSDSLAVYNNGEKRKDELIQQIDESEDFTPEDKEILKGGLTTGHVDGSAFRERFPIVTYNRDIAESAFAKLYLDGQYCELRLLRVMKIAERFLDIVKLSGGWMDDVLFWTHYAPHAAARHPKRATMVKDTQIILREVAGKLTEEDIHYLDVVCSAFRLYMPVKRGENDTIVVNCSTLPYLPNLKIIELDGLGKALKVDAYLLGPASKNQRNYRSFNFFNFESTKEKKKPRPKKKK